MSIKKIQAKRHCIKRYGWIPSLPDRRDRCFKIEAAGPLPDNVDLRPYCPPVYDQGQLGSCTANAIGGAFEFDQLKQGLTSYVPSRLFIYYNERVIEHTVKSDSGAQIRDGMKVIQTVGAPDEALWPYRISKFATKPTAKVYNAAKLHEGLVYEAVGQSEQNIMATLASGFPIVLGFSVYASFESQSVAASGVVPMPAHNEELLGGHAVLAVGYTKVLNLPKAVKNTTYAIVRNSWGDSWGDKGYFYMPLEYLTNTDLSSDFWVLRNVK